MKTARGRTVTLTKETLLNKRHNLLKDDNIYSPVLDKEINANLFTLSFSLVNIVPSN